MFKGQAQQVLDLLDKESIRGAHYRNKLNKLRRGLKAAIVSEDPASAELDVPLNFVLKEDFDNGTTNSFTDEEREALRGILQIQDAE